MATLRELKGRIGSVASSEKITGAMKMISSAKMHKAEGALRRLVPFRSQIETIIGNLLSSDAQFSSALVTERAEIKHMCVVVWGSDDGLCGAYNVNLYKRLIVLIGELRQQVGANAQIAVMPIGRKMRNAVSKIKLAHVSVVDAPEGIDSKVEGDKVNNFIGSLQQQFEDGTYDRIDALYMRYYTAGRQRPVSLQLLPVLPETFATDGKAATGRPYLFEPDANSIFNTVLPMYLMAAMQDVFTQNRASEAAARVMAMQSANDNAKTLLEELQLEYNKLRQQSITSELLDIVGGQVHD
jgi:F-type H+-transporting ATPase subunit gamma